MPLAAFTKGTMAASDGGFHHDPLAGGKSGDTAAHVHDLGAYFMAEDMGRPSINKLAGIHM